MRVTLILVATVLLTISLTSALPNKRRDKDIKEEEHRKGDEETDKDVEKHRRDDKEKDKHKHRKGDEETDKPGKGDKKTDKHRKDDKETDKHIHKPREDDKETDKPRKFDKKPDKPKDEDEDDDSGSEESDESSEEEESEEEDKKGHKVEKRKKPHERKEKKEKKHRKSHEKKEEKKEKRKKEKHTKPKKSQPKPEKPQPKPKKPQPEPEKKNNCKAAPTEEEVRKSYAQCDSEDTLQYYERIIAKSCAGESTEDYIRTRSLVKKCYPDLALWYDIKYIGLVKKYYGPLYTRCSGETDDEYYLRITKSEDYENEDQCARRLEIERNLFPSLSLWYEERYYEKYTQQYYRNYYKRTTNEEESVYFSRVVARAAEECDVSYWNRIDLIKRTYPELELWYEPRYLTYTQDYYFLKYTKTSETEESFYRRILTKEVYESEVYYTKKMALLWYLSPNLHVWTDESYFEQTQNLYLTVFQIFSDENESTYFRRITTRFPEECDEFYIKRMDIIRRAHCGQDLWYNPKYLDFTREYYTVKYTFTSSETQESFYKRVTLRESQETDIQYASRIRVINRIHPHWPLWCGSEYRTYTDNYYSIYYSRSETEEQNSYYKRITEYYESETRQEYVGRIGRVKETHSNLDLWYDKDYLNLVEYYYTSKYTYSYSETKEFYELVTTSEYQETDKQCVNRLAILNCLYPHWSLWYNSEYSEYTHNYYSTYYSQSVTEEKEAYYQRITEKYESETEQEYVYRVNRIKQTHCDLDLWYNKAYLNHVEYYYTRKYTYSYSETKEFYQSVTTAEYQETDEQCVNRLAILNYMYPNWSLWYNSEYSEYTHNYYSTYYSQSVTEEKEVYYKRITEKYESETEQEYVYRVNRIKQTHCDLDLWYNKAYLNHVEYYYTRKYTYSYSETKEFYQSVTTAEYQETDEQCVNRLAILNYMYPNWSLWYNSEYSEYTHNYYSTYYSQSVTEEKEVYYKRITEKYKSETEQEYVYRVNRIKQTHCDLDLWYNKAYLNHVEYYYTRKYTYSYSETKEFYQSVTTAEYQETDEQCVNRLAILNYMYPNWSLWYNSEYSEYTHNYYSTYYSQSVTEEKEAYYQRITEKYESETEQEYVYRVNRIKQTHCDLDLWYNKAYLNHVEYYYTRKYTYSYSETKEFYQSVTTAEYQETDEQCVNRLAILNYMYPNWSLWYNSEYSEYTHNYYSTYYSQSVTEEKEVYYKRITEKYKSETEQEYVYRVNRIKQTHCDLDLWYNKAYLNHVEYYYTRKYTYSYSETKEFYQSVTTAEYQETDEQCVNRLAILNYMYPNWSLWYNSEYSEYTHNYYSTYYSQSVTEEKEVYYKRITEKYKSETEQEYVYRVNRIKQTHCDLDLWYNKAYLNHVEYYYTRKYTYSYSETKEFYQSVTTAEYQETDEQCVNRLAILNYMYPNWSLWYNSEYSEYTHNYYSTYYSQSVTEEKEVYYKRITEKYESETEQEYVYRVNRIKQTHCDLDLWYNKAYLNHVEYYYTRKYTYSYSETKEFYQSVTTAEYQETDEQCVNRLAILNYMYPNWSLWYNSEYSEYTHNYYSTYYSQSVTEEKEVYYKRITEKYKSETEQEYVYRVNRIKQTHCDLDLWYNKAYLNHVEYYYTRKYTYSYSETKEFYQSVTTAEYQETDEQCVNRLAILNYMYPNWSLWYNSEYSEYTHNYYSTYYSQSVTEEKEIYYKRITEKYESETEQEYVYRVNRIKQTHCDLDLWYNKANLNHVEYYYTRKYTYSYSETKEFYQSVTTAEYQETDEQCVNRLAILNYMYPNWSLWYNSEYSEYTHNYYSTYYSQSVTEEKEVYYKRITEKYESETEQEYVYRVNRIKQTHCDLDLWYNKAYLNHVEYYYTRKYTYSYSETKEFYQSVTTAEYQETDEQCASRLDMIRTCHPKWSLWYNREYSEYTHNYYSTYYSQSVTEEKEVYYKRITEKYEYETEQEYVYRVDQIKETHCDLDLWYNKAYLNHVEYYYTRKYTYSYSETKEFYQSVTTAEYQETDEQCASRLDMIRTCHPKWSLWYNREYSEYTHNYYSTYYSQSVTEEKEVYYKRITEKYEYETEQEYLYRVDRIKETHCDLDLWYNKAYLNHVEYYYTKKYTYSYSETKEFYQSVTTAEYQETDEQCASRLDMIRTCHPKWSLWYNREYSEYTHNYYSTYYSQSVTEEKEVYYKRITEKYEYETEQEYLYRVDRIKETHCDLDLWYNKAYLNHVEYYYTKKYTYSYSETKEFYQSVTTAEYQETDEQCARRLDMIRTCHPKWSLWYNREYSEYTHNYYSTYYSQSVTEEKEVYYKRITEKYEYETEQVYISRLDRIKQTHCELDLWYKEENLDFVQNYYLAKYTSYSETEEIMYKHILARDEVETVEQWTNRVEMCHILTPNLPVWYNSEYYYLTKEFYSNYYTQLLQTCEDEISYYKKVTKQYISETSTSYSQRLSLVKQSCPNLDLWYSKQYLEVTKTYYTIKYTKTYSETDESLYRRVLNIEYEETVEQWSSRVEVIHTLHPNWDLWCDYKYNDLIKNVYSIQYQRAPHEGECDYFRRLVTRYEHETDACYLGRMKLIQENFSDLLLWSSLQYFNIVKHYYSLKYTKCPTETDEAYFARLVARESCDVSDEDYASRVYIVQLLTYTDEFWYDSQYYEKYTKNFYSIYYNKLDSETCKDWMTRAIALLPEETDANAITRVGLIKRAAGNCGCWNKKTLCAVGKSNAYKPDYIDSVRNTYFTSK